MLPPEHNLPPLPPTDNRPLWDIWLSGFRLPALTAADELGIFAYLDNTPSTTDEISRALGLGMRSAEALLNLLGVMGFIIKLNGVFHLNDLSRSYLLPDSPHYWGGVLHSVRDTPVSHAMIMDAIRRDSGEYTLSKQFRKFTDDWNRKALTDEQAVHFTEKMHSHGFASAISLARFDEFKGIMQILDVGGGSGCYSIALAATHPKIRCTIADLPQVCKIADRYINMYSVADKVFIKPFDMFMDNWPSGHDAVFLSDVLHDWSTEHCLMLVKMAFDSLPRHGKILINEVLLSDNHIGPLTANAYSLAMLSVTEGKQFKPSELMSILAEAGFESLKIKPAYGYYSLISGLKP